MADACSSKATGWIILSPIPQDQIKQTMKAFIDDVNLFIGKSHEVSKVAFFQLAQDNINCWHGILQATGGELNTKKCFWSDFQHSYDKHGNHHVHQQMPNDPHWY